MYHNLNSSESLADRSPSDSCGVGMVVAIDNKPSHRILQLGLKSLANVAHRGGIGSDGKTADGAGVTTSLPRRLIDRWLSELGVFERPPLIGIGVVFLPDDSTQMQTAMNLVVEQILSLGLRVLAVRDVPVDQSQLGIQAAQRCPRVRQVMVTGPTNDAEVFERELFLARREIELIPHDREMKGFYVASMSCHTLVYKAMVRSECLKDFYTDLKDPDFECEVCLYHQRFSTNTAPQWELCQPFRRLAHNGEINTIRGNRNWMTAREVAFEHPFWQQHRACVRRLFNFNDSDSASLDNSLELLTLSGRSLAHALTMLIPPAWENAPRMTDEQKAFYEFHSCFCEPWDGPALIAATDGLSAVACLDRNGLRPARYKITKDQILILGSEVGCERIDESEVLLKGRLAPGEMIVVNLQQKRVLFDSEIKTELATRRPYALWLNEHLIRFKPVPLPYVDNLSCASPDFMRLQIAAGLGQEEIDIGLKNMAIDGVEPTFSMGVDTPLAVLSRQPRLLADYFKQRFAQVTNPPIDPIRESMIMSLATGLGPERNILDETPYHCRIISLEHPVFLPSELEQLKANSPFPFSTLDCTWPRVAGEKGLQSALHRIVQEAQLAVDNQAVVIVLSDRGQNAERVAIPMLMAVGAVHHALSRSGQRIMCSLVAETSDVRDPHHLALLFGYGCTAVDPYLAFATLARLQKNDDLGPESLEHYFLQYRSALTKGLLKIMSKMGISVLNSYQGAQVFEAIGLGPSVIETCFKYSFTNLSGIGFEELGHDCLVRHDMAFQTPTEFLELSDIGLTKPKRAGEHHVINGRVTKSFHRFVRENNAADFEDFQKFVTPERPVAIRDLLEFQTSTEGRISIENVESIADIRRRFTTAAMSLGAISPEAHEAIAIAMNQIGGKSNSGEGGEDAERANVRPDGSWANSKIKQIASGRFGVNAHYLATADELEIKMAQGAKPGEGGQLPGFKVDRLIAKLRNTEPGITLISPPPHHDIYSIEDLAQLIFDLKMVNPAARVCVKLVAKTDVGGIAVGVAKSHADVILISGHEGGTGASPLTSIKHAGIPWELGLAESHQSLVASGLRNRVILRADGGMRTGRDVIHAAILGAEEYNFGTMALIALGCVYVKKCHLNNCPVGIATQDPKFRSKFKGKPENLVNYLNAVAQECREILASLGVRSIDELIGQTQLLRAKIDPKNRKTSFLKLDSLLHKSMTDWVHEKTNRKYWWPPKQFPSFDDSILEQLIVDPSNTISLTRQIENTDRNIGTRLAGFIASRFGSKGLTEGTVRMQLNGTAGQSLGAFLCNGIQITIVGEANDYVGKGMSGGQIALRSPSTATYKSHESVIAGNTLLYGATGGRLFASGQVAERFAVRNSGAEAVVEGCGDHGCEYMTRGTVVVLGPVGNNFAAGMTGGEAFVYDPGRKLPLLLNRQTVIANPATVYDEPKLFELVSKHWEQTNSAIAKSILEDWTTQLKFFTKVFAKSVVAEPARIEESHRVAFPISAEQKPFVRP